MLSAWLLSTMTTTAGSIWFATGETKVGKGEVRLFRNLGPEGFKDVTAEVGLDKIHLDGRRGIITGDYDGDGATDLLITQNHGPAVLLAE